MKKFAFMMVAAVAMMMTVSMTSCGDKNKTAEGDSLQNDTTLEQVEAGNDTLCTCDTAVCE